ncbi:MAG: DUF6316 family protein [Gammaproteobacteria bacterium]|nr:DUF6316 family protein [Gammaproteobacteria bacterium]MDD9894664.1 DUF6316 family protein [Gammaproteobacteria bacterium]MDD9960224.1 DUF6316 family protein [Gammaproteobacteria bacterium]
MSESRHQDHLNTATPARSDRVYSQQNLWYFRTREGEEIGPFRYRSEAESNLDRFIARLKEKLQHS